MIVVRHGLLVGLVLRNGTHCILWLCLLRPRWHLARANVVVDAEPQGSDDGPPVWADDPVSGSGGDGVLQLHSKTLPGASLNGTLI
jgi:hypothetical protein